MTNDGIGPRMRLLTIGFWTYLAGLVALCVLVLNPDWDEDSNLWRIVVLAQIASVILYLIGLAQVTSRLGRGALGAVVAIVITLVTTPLGIVAGYPIVRHLVRHRPPVGQARAGIDRTV